ASTSPSAVRPGTSTAPREMANARSSSPSTLTLAPPERASWMPAPVASALRPIIPGQPVVAGALKSATTLPDWMANLPPSLTGVVLAQELRLAIGVERGPLRRELVQPLGRRAHLRQRDLLDGEAVERRGQLLHVQRGQRAVAAHEISARIVRGARALDVLLL